MSKLKERLARFGGTNKDMEKEKRMNRIERFGGMREMKEAKKFSNG